VRDPEGTIRAASETAIKEVLGDFTVDEVITTAREEVAAKAKLSTQDLLDNYEIGVNVVDVKLRNVNPPTREVQDAFEEVNRAEQRRDELINNAEAEYNATIPRARGLAQQRIEQAMGTRQARINVAQGEADQFELIRREFNKAREITRQRLYLEAWGDILPKLGKKIIVDGDLRGLMQLLNLQEAVREGGER
jgi:membrane protease subunit HflK